MHFLVLPPLATCANPVWHPTLRGQQTGVSRNQPLCDWPTRCQQTSEDERHWSVVSTRVRTAPTQSTCSLSLSTNPPPSQTCTHTHTQYQLWWGLNAQFHAKLLFLFTPNSRRKPNASSMLWVCVRKLTHHRMLNEAYTNIMHDSFYFARNHPLHEPVWAKQPPPSLELAVWLNWTRMWPTYEPHHCTNV